MIHNSNKKGFSFLEVMAVVTMIGIMTSIVLVFQGKNRVEKEVETAAREIAAMTRDVQNRSLTGKVPAGGETPCSYSIRLKQDALPNDNDLIASTYADIKVSENGTFTCDPTTPQGKSDAFDQYEIRKTFKGIIVDTSSIAPCPGGGGPNDHVIRFKIPFGKIDACGFGYMGTYGNETSAKMLIWSAKDTDVKYTICVYEAGRVEEVRGDVSC